jgi:hypothetical protein
LFHAGSLLVLQANDDSLWTRLGDLAYAHGMVTQGQVASAVLSTTPPRGRGQHRARGVDAA